MYSTFILSLLSGAGFANRFPRRWEWIFRCYFIPSSQTREIQKNLPSPLKKNKYNDIGMYIFDGAIFRIPNPSRPLIINIPITFCPFSLARVLRKKCRTVVINFSYLNLSDSSNNFSWWFEKIIICYFYYFQINIF